MKLGFAPRAQALTLYGVLPNTQSNRLAQLGKHQTGKGCLYIKRLADIDTAVLQQLICEAAAR